MELLVGIALKTIGNYLEHFSPVPLDQGFAAEGNLNRRLETAVATSGGLSHHAVQLMRKIR